MRTPANGLFLIVPYSNFFFLPRVRSALFTGGIAKPSVELEVFGRSRTMRRRETTFFPAQSKTNSPHSTRTVLIFFFNVPKGRLFFFLSFVITENSGNKNCYLCYILFNCKKKKKNSSFCPSRVKIIMVNFYRLASALTAISLKIGNRPDVRTSEFH